MSEKKFPIEDITNKIKDILLEPEIRFCGLIDSTGELVTGQLKSGIIPLENDSRRPTVQGHPLLGGSDQFYDWTAPEAR